MSAETAAVRSFIPLNIAVLTVSDTRSLGDDKSGTTLAEIWPGLGKAAADRVGEGDETPTEGVAMDGSFQGWKEAESTPATGSELPAGVARQPSTRAGALGPHFTEGLCGMATMTLSCGSKPSSRGEAKTISQWPRWPPLMLNG